MKHLCDFLLNQTQNKTGEYLQYCGTFISPNYFFLLVILKLLNVFIDRYRKESEASLINSLKKNNVSSYNDGKKKIKFKKNRNRSKNLS